MRRRDFVSLVGGVAAGWPLAARAQQAVVPVIGYLGTGFQNSDFFLAPLRQGLGETGFIEGQNLSIEYRYAENQLGRLPELAAELVHRQVGAIVTLGSTFAAQAAKAATSTIPIVFDVSNDPVDSGLVASLNKPGGNATGVNYLSFALVAKRMGLLNELVPSATLFSVLTNPESPFAGEVEKEVGGAANALGRKIEYIRASNSREIDSAFQQLLQKRTDALLVVNNTLFTNRRAQIVTWATRSGLPAIYTSKDFVEAGGLMSYGPSLADAHRQVGNYVGRILKGAKPADLPVLQPTRFELVINLNTAKTLGIAVPPTLLARADEVIE